MNNELNIDILQEMRKFINAESLPCGYVVRPEVEQLLYEFCNEPRPVAISPLGLWNFYGVRVYSKNQKADAYVFYNLEAMNGYLNGLIPESVILQILKDTKYDT